MRLINVLICCLLLIPASTVLADTIHVPADQPTIQAGIDAAQDGDTVLVAPGAYMENIDFLGKAVTVESSDGPEVTIIDGSQPTDPDFGSVVTFSTSEGTDSVICGFTIINGTGTYFYYPERGVGYSSRLGGGVYCEAASPTVTNNIITGNSVENGWRKQSTLGVIVGYARGGGVYCEDSGAIIAGNQIFENHAKTGGGVYCYSNVTLSQNDISYNTADGDVGGVALGSEFSSLVVNNHISFNESGSVWTAAGGADLGGSGLLVIGNTVNNNITGDWGGGLVLHGGSPVVRNNFIFNNQVLGETFDGGGGIHINSCDATVENNLVFDNFSSLSGGGIFAYNSDVQLRSNSFSSNTANLNGGGIYLEGSTVTVIASIWDGNTGQNGDQGYLANSSSISIEYTDVTGGGDSFVLEKGCTIDFGDGVIDADPEFIAGPKGDHYLSQVAAGQPTDSPCVDTGDPLSPIINGTTRSDEIPDTDILDMGFHYPPAGWDYICAGPGAIELEQLATDPPIEEQMLIWSCSDGLLDWTLSEDAGWLTVSEISGTASSEFSPVMVTIDPMGLTPGDYSAMITLDAPDAENTTWQSIVALRIGQILIRLDTFPDMDFEAAVGDDPPSSHSLYIWSGDLGILDWSVSCAAPWATLAPQSGSSTGEHDRVIVSVDHTGLSVGKYESEIIVEAQGAANSPRTVPITLTVGEMIIDYLPASFAFEAIVENDPPDPQDLRLWNDGLGTMSWQVSTPASWLTLDPDTGVSGGENDYVTVEADHLGLTPGSYESTITIDAPGAVNSPQVIPVQFTVHPLGIGFHPESFTFQCDVTSDPPPEQTLEIWNTMEGWMLWRLGTDVDWLSFSQVSGYSAGEHDEVQVSVDQAGLQSGTHTATITIEADGAANSPQYVPVTLVVEDANRVARLVTAPGPGPTSPSLIRLFPPEQDASAIHEFTAYASPGYGANVTIADLDGDLFEDVLTGPGPGDVYGPHVRGFEADGTPLVGLSFLAYGTNKYGVNVASGDLDGDGFDEIVTGAGPGAVFGPHVRAFDYDGTPGVIPVPGVSFFAYGTPKWGVNVAAGDIDGDGFDEIITGPGPGAVYGPHVRGWNVDGGPATAIPAVSFMAYGTNKYGVNVTAGDLDGDGIDEIATGAGPGAVFGPHVRGWNYDGAAVTPLSGYSFFAWQTPPLRFGVNVFAGADLNNDGRDELVVGRGPDPEADTEVKVFTYDGVMTSQWLSLEAFPGLTHGTNVAAGRF